jgi:hypothetical protein
MITKLSVESVNPVVLIKTGFNGLKDGQDDFCWCGGLMGWIDWVVFKSVKKAVVKITYYLYGILLPNYDNQVIR